MKLKEVGLALLIAGCSSGELTKESVPRIEQQLAQDIYQCIDGQVEKTITKGIEVRYADGETRTYNLVFQCSYAQPEEVEVKPVEDVIPESHDWSKIE